MLIWIKALFAKEEKKIDPDNFVPYTDIFTPNFLADLYVLFQNHVNETFFTTAFPEKIKQNMTTGREWENSCKIMKNLEMGWSEEEVCNFLEQLCYNTWFAQMQTAGHSFTDHEKSALAGFAFYADSSHDEDYPFLSIDEQIQEMRSSTPQIFIDKVFDMNVGAMVAQYNRFTQKECPA